MKKESNVDLLEYVGSSFKSLNITNYMTYYNYLGIVFTGMKTKRFVSLEINVIIFILYSSK